MGLAFKPEVHGEEYWTWKQNYAVHALIFCDDGHRIRHIVVGWPASIHDNRVWKNCNIFLQKEDYFSENEYGLGGSAFTNSNVMVTAYKKVAGCPLPAG